jgi:peptide-methionine (S)-S-oxide reductase
LRRVLLSLDGKEHDLAVGYVAATPLWRPSYRVVVGKDGADLQVWGIVQNLSGEDWKNVELTLVAGAPIAFESTLGDPITPVRPVITDTGEIIAQVPEGITTLGQQPGGTVERYAPDEQAEPAAEAAAQTSGLETAVLAGGCFWGIQAVYQHVKGVTNAVSGYAGGAQKDALYETVSAGRTGHAEAVQVTFDPREVSYGKILQIYFSVAHDPTQLNRQGPDSGTQYRSEIFPQNEAQAKTAKAYIAQLDAAHVFKKPIVTKIEPDHAFYPAEAYHQDFLTRNPRYPYIAINDLPKIEDLKRLAPDVYRAAPVLVAGGHSSR